MINDAFKENFKNELVREVKEVMNEFELTLDQCYVRVIAKWLGYQIDDDNIVDGAGDRGIDFWYASDYDFDIFQIKTHMLLPYDKINTSDFGNEGVLDLHRIKTYLLDGKSILENNKNLKTFKERWNYAVSSKKLADINEEIKPINVNLGLVIVGGQLTKQAQEELDAFKRSVTSPIKLYDNVIIEFNVYLYTLDDILLKRWKEENRQWRNIDGAKQNWIDLHPDKMQSLDIANSRVFYCPAIDMVLAYENFGYQIFEPNVRCNIKKSQVNLDIKESIKHRQSRKEFRFLNNGVTMMCKRFEKPSKNRPTYRVFEPGIINGLQTVISISEAYNDLSPEDKADFEENCFLLIRLLTENTVKEPDKVVRATNNQNKMEPRNLYSNSAEQILFERLFAQLGWFYERKDGAWNAFETDPNRWRTLSNKKKIDFCINSNDRQRGRQRVRCVDNEEIAQSWLSFIGFSDLAVHEKSQIFVKQEWYKLIFLSRVSKHGALLDYSIPKALENLINTAPTPELLLTSFLARRFAKEMTLSPKENFEAACKRLEINYSELSKEEVNNKLINDNDYLLGLALSGMSFTFVEYFGYLLFRSLNDDVHNIGNKLIQNKTLLFLKNNFSFKEIKQSISNQEFEPEDIICVTWYSFRHVIEQMLGTYWAQKFRTATNRSRFIAEKGTREQIIKTLEEVNKYSCKFEITQIWASGIKPPTGLYGFFRNILTK